MQRKFLEDMGLEKDVIDKIMAENGTDINKTKEKLEAERDNYKSQLEIFSEARELIDDYIYFYNYQRIQSKTNVAIR